MDFFEKPTLHCFFFNYFFSLPEPGVQAAPPIFLSGCKKKLSGRNLSNIFIRYRLIKTSIKSDIFFLFPYTLLIYHTQYNFIPFLFFLLHSTTCFSFSNLYPARVKDYFSLYAKQPVINFGTKVMQKVNRKKRK